MTARQSSLDLGTTPEIFPVYSTTIYYHGTRAPLFDTPRTGTCFTPYLHIAERFADRGSYQRSAPIDGPPRIITAYVNLPEGAIFMPGSPTFNQLLDVVDQGKVWNNESQTRKTTECQQMRKLYHDDATAEALRLGFRAYFADLYNDPYSALVVLDPTVVHIQSHDLTACAQA